MSRFALAFLLALLACATSVRAQGSDDCATAQVLPPGPGIYAVSTVGATLTTAQPPCGTIAKDVWFSWTPNASGEGRIDTCSFGSGNSLIAVYAGAGCPSGAPIACNDDYCGVRAQVIFAANAGTTYLLRFGVVGTGDVGLQFQVLLNTLAPNDECALATVISGTGTFPVNTLGATQGVPQSICDHALADVWYAWTAPATGTAELSTCGATTASTVVSAWTGPSCATATEIGCSSFACANQARVTFGVTAGSPYLLHIGQITSTAYTGTFTLSMHPPPVNDDCSAPIALSGSGVFPYDLTYATTGIEGQNESLCLGGTSTVIERDVWYLWTATVTGNARFSTCEGTSTNFNTKVAVYAGGGCPTQGSALACNDQACQSLAEVCFPALAGTTYLLQLGVGFASAPTSGTFTLVEQAGTGTNDDCATPLTIGGAGPFAFDTTNATAGCAGQHNSICGGSPFDVIARDRWYTWVADATGDYEISTCGLTGGAATKLAVYVGTGCPTPGSEIACSRFATCGGTQSRVCFVAQAGTAYTIQVGTPSSSANAIGSFTIQPKPALAGCRYDDGSSENAGGFYQQSGSVLWLQRFGVPGTTSTITAVSTAFGSPAVFPAAPPNGTSCVIGVWDDPDDDGDPSNAVLLQTVSGVVTSSHTDTLVTFPLAHAEVVSGAYFVGAAIQNAFGTLPAPMDSSSCIPYSFDRAWFVGSLGGFLDLAHLSSNNVPPSPLHGSVWLLTATCTADSGTVVCAGDGTGAACPCGNASAVLGSGCKHSLSDSTYAGAGGRLAVQGEASLSHDQVRLHATTLPPTASCLFFQGTTTISAAFGDGLRCAGGVVRRLGVRVASSGVADLGFGVGADPAVHFPGAVIAPGARTYQVWFRNPATYCTAAAYNLTNGVRVDWAL